MSNVPPKHPSALVYDAVCDFLNSDGCPVLGRVAKYTAAKVDGGGCRLAFDIELGPKTKWESDARERLAEAVEDYAEVWGGPDATAALLDAAEEVAAAVAERQELETAKW